MIWKKKIPGFKFLNGSCDPCGALNENPDYSCKYSLDIKGVKPGVSNVWKKLWGIN